MLRGISVGAPAVTPHPTRDLSFIRFAVASLTMGKLEEIRAAVAQCSVLGDGATPEARQRENAQRLRVFRQLDSYAAELTASAAAAAAAESTSEEVAGIEVNERVRQRTQQRVIPPRYLML